jgi:uncharacterized membrane protein
VITHRGVLVLLAAITTQGPAAAGEEPLPRAWAEARERGVMLRAVGNEPGWLLELHADGRALLVTDYGARRERFEAMLAEDDDAPRANATVAGVPFTATFHPGPCSDTMSDLVYPLRAAVALGTRRLRGCALDLR